MICVLDYIHIVEQRERTSNFKSYGCGHWIVVDRYRYSMEYAYDTYVLSIYGRSCIVQKNVRSITIHRRIATPPPQYIVIIPNYPEIL
jgi:hypothetical protein